MKITRLTLILILLLSVFAVSSAYAQQEEEPTLTFTILEDGQSVTNTFEGSVNAQLYVFIGSAGDIVEITMVQADDSFLDPYIVLLGPAGQVYASDDDSGDEPLSSQISGFELPEDGTYFVLATTFNGLRAPEESQSSDEAEPVTYEISVSGINTPADLVGIERFDYLAGQMEIGGDAIVLSITPEESVFYITFPGEDGDILSIITADDNDGPAIDTLLYLFDPNGNRIAVNDDGEGIGLYSSIENIELPEDGLYMIFATSWDFAEAYEEEWANEGTFSIVIE